MREIKFRAKTLDGIWFLWKLLDPVNMAELAIDSKTLGQFTGFKSKSGIEIYEGDVVRSTHTWNTSMGYDDKPYTETSNRAVEWDNKHGQWKCVFSLNDTLEEWHNAEVIGNIYENKELLK